MDATSAFRHLDMKDFWKKKIGSDKARVSMTEFCEVFLATIEVGIAFYIGYMIAYFEVLISCVS